MNGHDLAAAEIRRLHRGFEGWFNGDEQLDFAEIERALAADFSFIPPNGEMVDRAELLEHLRRAFGTRPIRIRIERPVVRWETDVAILATYEEWHEHARYTTTRRSTALFTPEADAPGGLLWRHVHETWIRRPPHDG